MKNFNIVTKVNVYTLSECSDDIALLIDRAKTSSLSAYAPYSEFRVGAAILLENGIIITGNNQENAAYPSGLCAERVALFYANANYSNIAVTSIAIIAFHQGKFTQNVCSPCGSCRQALIETENRYNKPIQVILPTHDEIYVIDSAKNLLPISFGEDLINLKDTTI